MFEITAIPAFRDNYIWGLCRNGRAVVVDPGDAAPVLDWLASGALALEAILITHHHQDHQGGVPGLLERYPGLQVFGPGAESITGLNHPLAGGEMIQVLDTPVAVWSVPGHTCGHLAYLAEDALFCGDTLFGAGCGRLFEGTPEDMFATVGRFDALPGDTRLYSGHDYAQANLDFAARFAPDPAALSARRNELAQLAAQGAPTTGTTLASERLVNPYLRTHLPEVAQAAELPGATALQVFAEIRKRKDNA